MAETIDSDTGCKIQELAILYIPQPRALSFDEYRRRTSICSDHVRSMLVHNGSTLRVGCDVGIWQRSEASAGDPRTGNGAGAGQSSPEG